MVSLRGAAEPRCPPGARCFGGHHPHCLGCALGASGTRLLPAPAHHGSLAGRGVADAGGPLSTNGAGKAGVSGRPRLAVGPVLAVFAYARHALRSLRQMSKVSVDAGDLLAVGPPPPCPAVCWPGSYSEGPGRGPGPGKRRADRVSEGSLVGTGEDTPTWAGCRWRCVSRGEARSLGCGLKGPGRRLGVLVGGSPVPQKRQGWPSLGTVLR